jgi:aspartyl-tRNA(Asn)/glutamyl-tRNA(Gln) amidotransferase subunit C
MLTSAPFLILQAESLPSGVFRRSDGLLRTEIHPMSLDKATVAKIAHLARIKVPEAEQEALAGELSNILSFVEQLGQVDTEGVQPMTSVESHKLRWREDVVSDGGIRDKILTNAPEAAEGFFAVPKVVE